jgi:hypothetical protein
MRPKAKAAKRTQSAKQRLSNMKDRSNHSLFIVGQLLLIHPTPIASNNQNRRSSLYQRRHPRADTLGNRVASKAVDHTGSHENEEEEEPKDPVAIRPAQISTGSQSSGSRCGKCFNAMVVGNHRI